MELKIGICVKRWPQNDDHNVWSELESCHEPLEGIEPSAFALQVRCHHEERSHRELLLAADSDHGARYGGDGAQRGQQQHDEDAIAHQIVARAEQQAGCRW